MRSSEVRNLKLFEMTIKNRILELLVTNFTRTLSELPKQPIVHCIMMICNENYREMEINRNMEFMQA